MHEFAIVGKDFKFNLRRQCCLNVSGSFYAAHNLTERVIFHAGCNYQRALFLLRTSTRLTLVRDTDSLTLSHCSIITCGLSLNC